MNRSNSLYSIFNHPVVFLISTALGVFLGYRFQSIRGIMEKAGLYYIKLLQLLVIPILASIIISSIAKLTRYSLLKQVVTKIILSFVLTLFISSFLGVAAGIIGEPGKNLKEEQIIELGKVIASDNSGENAIFDNTITTLNNGKAFMVVFFSILIGVSVGINRFRKNDYIIEIFDGLSEALEKVNKWFMLFLPIGIIFLISSQIDNYKGFMLQASIRLIVTFYIVSAIIFILGFLIIWFRSGQKVHIVFKGLLRPVIVSIITRSTIASLPVAVDTMKRELKFNSETTNLFVPLGQTLGRFGNILFFSLAGVFSMQLYSYQLTPFAISVIIAASVIAGLSTAGSSGLLTLGLLTSILKPLNIPLEAIILIFLSIDIILDPVRSFLIVFINLIITSIVAEPKSSFSDDIIHGVLLQNFPDDINLRKYFNSFDGEIALLNIDKGVFLESVFPNAKFRSVKKWDNLNPHWESFDINIVVGEKEEIKNVSQKLSGDFRSIVLNRHH